MYLYFFNAISVFITVNSLITGMLKSFIKECDFLLLGEILEIV